MTITSSGPNAVEGKKVVPGMIHLHIVSMGYQSELSLVVVGPLWQAAAICRSLVMSTTILSYYHTKYCDRSLVKNTNRTFLVRAVCVPRPSMTNKQCTNAQKLRTAMHTEQALTQCAKSPQCVGHVLGVGLMTPLPSLDSQGILRCREM